MGALKVGEGGALGEHPMTKRKGRTSACDSLLHSWENMG